MDGSATRSATARRLVNAASGACDIRSSLAAARISGLHTDEGGRHVEFRMLPELCQPRNDRQLIGSVARASWEIHKSW